MSPKGMLIKLGVEIESFVAYVVEWLGNGRAHPERLAEARVPVISDPRLMNLSSRNSTRHCW